MKKISILIIVLMLSLTGCSGDSADGVGSDGGPSSEGVLPGNGGEPGEIEPGVITAGEWNDLDNWSFWENLKQGQDYGTMEPYWSFYTASRISVHVTSNNGLPAINVPVVLQRGQEVLYTARTDNKGKAELWESLFSINQANAASTITLNINGGQSVVNAVKHFSEGINEVTLTQVPDVANKIEVAFVVDATGSMGDELEYLKTELYDVISRVKNDNPQAAVVTSSLFYRDEGDNYVTRVSGFTDNISTTLNFIKNQSADGGGDFPEAVHTALDKGINELQWSSNAKTRLLFLMLDAPPHYEPQVVSSIHTSILKAAEKGIKVIPVTASGIDKETEFLMRFFSIVTNGSYVFITNDSGVGNDHLEPSVGEYQVEFLNNLMVRLINKYAE
jgi:hypothetical protein